MRSALLAATLRSSQRRRAPDQATGGGAQLKRARGSVSAERGDRGVPRHLHQSQAGDAAARWQPRRASGGSCHAMDQKLGVGGEKAGLAPQLAKISQTPVAESGPDTSARPPPHTYRPHVHRTRHTSWTADTLAHECRGWTKQPHAPRHRAAISRAAMMRFVLLEVCVCGV